MSASGLVFLRAVSRKEIEAAGTRRLDLDFIVLPVLINGLGLALLAARQPQP